MEVPMMGIGLKENFFGESWWANPIIWNGHWSYYGVG